MSKEALVEKLMALTRGKTCRPRRWVPLEDVIGIVRQHAAWRPIESAPKNGSRFLGYNSEHGHFVCCYVGGYESGDVWFSCIKGNGVNLYDVTHWMPLPPPPEQGESD
jgi:hypothetical protein